jgi:hypothetical protein
MANDISQIQIGTTLYSWGGWDASGYHNEMRITDLLTGAQQTLPLGRVRFLAQGFVTNPAWNWIAGKLLYLAANGAMTQTRPISGPVTILGIAWSPTTICLDPQPPRAV